MKIVPIVVGIVVVFVLLVFGGTFYTVRETEIVILTQFGAPVGTPITEAGLHWKTPFVQEVNRIEKRVLEFDGLPVRMPTKDKTYVEVDTFGRWQITDATKFFLALRDERTAQSRLEDIVGSETRNQVAKHDLIEVVRSDKNRVSPTEAPNQSGSSTGLRRATRGRIAIEEDIKTASAPQSALLGITLLDVRIKRVNYNSDVLATIYQRMISEREQIAQRFRSEGEGEAARIQGKKDRDLREIESIAYKQVQEIRGAADAEASRIYAEAYDKSPEARDFYGFIKTLETYRSVLGQKTNLILSTDSDLFRLLEKSGK